MYKKPEKKQMNVQVTWHISYTCLIYNLGKPVPEN